MSTEVSSFYTMLPPSQRPGQHYWSLMVRVQTESCEYDLEPTKKRFSGAVCVKTGWPRFVKACGFTAGRMNCSQLTLWTQSARYWLLQTAEHHIHSTPLRPNMWLLLQNPYCCHSKSFSLSLSDTGFTPSFPPPPALFSPQSTDGAVPCRAAGSSLVLQQKCLIQCFKKLLGRMWPISFYTQSLNASNVLNQMQNETWI